MTEQQLQQRALTVIRNWFPGCTVTICDGTEDGDESGLVERGAEQVASFTISRDGVPTVGLVGQFCGTAEEQAAFTEWTYAKWKS